MIVKFVKTVIVFGDVVELTEAVGAVTDDCEIGKDREGLHRRRL